MFESGRRYHPWGLHSLLPCANRHRLPALAFDSEPLRLQDLPFAQLPHSSLQLTERCWQRHRTGTAAGATDATAAAGMAVAVAAALETAGSAAVADMAAVVAAATETAGLAAATDAAAVAGMAAAEAVAVDTAGAADAVPGFSARMTVVGHP